jgi:hypothetical protein
MYVYVATGPGGSKVGIAADVNARLASFKYERTRGLERIVQSWRIPGEARLIEGEALRLIRAEGHKAVKGIEQFDVDADVLVGHVKTAIKALGQRGRYHTNRPRSEKVWPRDYLPDTEKLLADPEIQQIIGQWLGA